MRRLLWKKENATLTVCYIEERDENDVPMKYIRQLKKC